MGSNDGIIELKKFISPKQLSIIKKYFFDTFKRENFTKILKSKPDLKFFTTPTSDNAEYRKEVASFLESHLAPIIEKTLPDFTAVFFNFIAKFGGTNNESHMHQDLPFVDEEKFENYTLWIPLEDVDEDDGPLYYIPNSHILFKNYVRGIQDFLDTDYTHLPYLQYIAELAKFKKFVTCKKGDAILIQCRCLHGSNEDKKSNDRICIGVPLVSKKADIFIYQKPLVEPGDVYYKISLNKDEFISNNFILDRLYEKYPFKRIISKYTVPKQEFNKFFKV